MPIIVHSLPRTPSSRPLFSIIISLTWHAHHHPYQPYYSAHHPVFGPTAADRARDVEASAERKWNAFVADESSCWIYAVDDANPEAVLGACLWKFYRENPYLDRDGEGKGGKMPYDVSMWPEGSTGREFVQEMVRKQYAHRERWLRRGHAVCHDMSVHPSHRRHGIGSQLMAWGMQRADELKLEVFLHATDFGRPVYQKYGLRVLQKIEIDMTRPDPTDEWERLRHDFGPLRFSLMWKPHGGVYEEGVTRLPWEKEEGNGRGF